MEDWEVAAQLLLGESDWSFVEGYITKISGDRFASLGAQFFSTQILQRTVKLILELDIPLEKVQDLTSGSPSRRVVIGVKKP